MCLALVVGLFLPASAEILGGNSCGAQIDPTVLTPGPFRVGDTVRIRLELQAAAIDGGSILTIPEVSYRLDCVAAGLPIIVELCQDEGEIALFAGDISTDCETDWFFDDTLGPNDVNLISVPVLQLAQDQSCQVEFDVQIAQPPTFDNTPNRIEAAAGFDGVCDNGLTGLARGSLALAVPQIDVDIRKQEEGPDSRTFGSGSDAPFEIEVCNTGRIPYETATLTDALALDCERELPLLEPGECHDFVCVAPGVTESFTNEICVEVSAKGVSASDCDPSEVIIADCDLHIDKTCSVPSADDPSTARVCEGQVELLTLEYTGLGCTATNNDQDGRVRCSGGVGMIDPIGIEVTDDTGETVYADVPALLLGERIEMSLVDSDGTPRSLRAGVTVSAGGDLERVTFRTDCSQPLRPGDQFGSFRVVGMTTSEGGSDELDAAPSGIQGETSCTIEPMAPAVACASPLTALSLRYTGARCAGTECGARNAPAKAAAPEAVRVECSARNTTYVDTGAIADVRPGHVIDVVAAEAGEDTLPQWTDCTVSDPTGGFRESVSIRTSCSSPISLGDVYGPFEVTGMRTRDAGPIGQGSEVTYHYVITNEGVIPATDVVAVDDKLGPITPMPIPVLQPGESVAYQRTVVLTETTTNTVVVTGDPECRDRDMVTVTVEPALGCRVTGGGNDVGFDTGNRYTFGGQAGAPGGAQPQPFGEWTHHQQSGPAGRFVFHAGTHSAPPGTEIDRIVCSDPGFCQPARPAPTKQIDFEGVGTFRTIQSSHPLLRNVLRQETHHWFDVHIEDLGEPGSQRGEENSDACPAEGSAGAPASCDCLDFYRIRIYEAFDPAFGQPDRDRVIYEEHGYIDGGNLQIHPPLDRPQPSAGLPQAVRLQYMGPSLNGPVTIKILPENFRNDPVVYEFPEGLATGTPLISTREQGFSVDARSHRRRLLGDFLSISVNGVEERLRTDGWMAPFRAGQPAPLDGDETMVGVPSSSWFVLDVQDE